MRRQLANPVGMTTGASTSHLCDAPFLVSTREAPALQRTDLMIASNARAACCAMSNLRVLQRLRQSCRRAWGSGNECLV
jgi:hypothetical protein